MGGCNCSKEEEEEEEEERVQTSVVSIVNTFRSSNSYFQEEINEYTETTIDPKVLRCLSYNIDSITLKIMEN